MGSRTRLRLTLCRGRKPTETWEFIRLPWCSLGGGGSGHAIAHERPADKRDDDHGEPRRHLGETIGEVAVGNSEVILLHGAIERVEVAPVRLNLSNFIIDNELLDRFRGSGSAVQCLVASDRDRRRLVGEWLRDLEEVQRRRVNGPRVAQNTLGFAVQVRELGRVGHGSDEGSRGIPGLGGVSAKAEACVVAACGEDEPVLGGGRAGGRVDCQDLFPVLQSQRVLDHLDHLGRCLAGCCLDWRRWH